MPIWHAVAAADGMQLHILLTGMHRGESADSGIALQYIPAAAVLHQGGKDLGGCSPLMAATGMAAITKDAAGVIELVKPDLLLLMGDRVDMIPGAMAALPFNVPIAHLHGGELTYGAIDDRVRHAMSKLSHLHFVATAEAGVRLIRLGEEPWRVHVVGAPGLDTLIAQPAVSRSEFCARVGLPSGDFALVTVHPETNSPAPLAPLEAVLSALAESDMSVLMTAANADSGGRQINELLAQSAKTRSDWVFLDTLGPEGYANALRHAAIMIGNSSSGIVEAGLFGLSVVNVGGRQDGRAHGTNVANVPCDADAITAAINLGRSARHDPAMVSFYGDGKATERIMRILSKLPSRERLLRKTFYAGDARLSEPWRDNSSRTVARRSTPESSGQITTRTRLVRELQRIGVEPGATLCVHTSLASLGFVVGGARTVVEALLLAVGEEGTIVMPAFSGDLSDPAAWRAPAVPVSWIDEIRAEMPGYDPRLTPTRRMGAVAELFRLWPGTIRSAHPQSSFAANGPNAERITGGHALDYRFGPLSPLAKLEELDALVLMLGAPWNTISLFYRTQDAVGQIVPEKRSAPVAQCCGQTVWVEYKDTVYSNSWFPDAVEDLLASGIATQDSIGGATTLIFRARSALDAVRTWRKARGAF